jgi:hypothetical protein
MNAVGPARVFTLGIAQLAGCPPGSAIHAGPLKTQPGPGRVWLIFLDDLHVDFRSTGRLRTLIKTIAGELVADGDLTAMLTTGPSSMAVDPTPDRALVVKRVGQATGSSMAPPDIVRVRDPRFLFDEVYYRAAVSMATAWDAVTGLERVQATGKAVIYISSGYGIESLPDASLVVSDPLPLPKSPLHNQPAAADIQQRFAALVTAARRAGVPVFAIDTRRLRIPADVHPVEASPEWLRYRANTRASLRALSERTGGVAVMEEQDLEAGLATIARTMRR